MPALVCKPVFFSQKNLVLLGTYSDSTTSKYRQASMIHPTAISLVTGYYINLPNARNAPTLGPANFLVKAITESHTSLPKHLK